MEGAGICGLDLVAVDVVRLFGLRRDRSQSGAHHRHVECTGYGIKMDRLGGQELTVSYQPLIRVSGISIPSVTLHNLSFSLNSALFSVLCIRDIAEARDTFGAYASKEHLTL